MINLQAYEGPEDDGSRAMTFPFEGHSVRVMDRDGEPWWVLADVCAALDIGHAPTVAKRLDDDEKATVVISNTGNLTSNRTIINQSGLFSLVLTSRKPEAKRFKKWVTAEVLPAIRKTGVGNIDTIPRIKGDGESGAGTAPIPGEEFGNSARTALDFSFEGKSVRVVDRHGERWWFLTDICKVLEISNQGNAAARLDDDEKDGIQITDSIGRAQRSVLVSEPGLYSLLGSSRKPEAKRFNRWVRHEVLPAIRKTGGYMVAAPDETPEALALRALTVLQDTVERQKAQLAISEPKAAGFDQITAGNYLPSIRKFFSMFDGVNLIAVPARLVELGYLYRDLQDNYRVRRERPRALELFREHIHQNSAWTAVTISLRAAGQEEMAELYRQGQIPLLKAFQQRLQ